MKEMRLYHYWRSSASWRVRWALEHKNLPYRAIPINLLTHEQRSPDYLKISPMGQVPLLELGSFRLTESLAILEWLEERFPVLPLLPRSSDERARARELALMMVSGTHPIQNLVVLQHLSSDQNVRKKWAQHWIRRGLGAYEKRVRETAGTFSIGGVLSFADLCLIPQCYNAVRFEVPLAEFPTVHGIYNHCLTLESCRRAEPSFFEKHDPKICRDENCKQC